MAKIVVTVIGENNVRVDKSSASWTDVMNGVCGMIRMLHKESPLSRCRVDTLITRALNDGKGEAIRGEKSNIAD